jgi:hypothetical protein
VFEIQNFLSKKKTNFFKKFEKMDFNLDDFLGWVLDSLRDQIKALKKL